MIICIREEYFGEIYSELSIYLFESCSGGPRLTWERDFPPQLEAPSSSVQSHRLDLELYHCFLYFSYVCFLVLSCSVCRSVKFINTLPSDKYG